MALFPGALPAASSAVSTDTLAAAGHTALHNTDRDEIRAIATKVGTGASTPTNATFLRGNGAGTSAWAAVTLTTDVTGTLPVANGGTGVTTSTGTGSTVLSSGASMDNLSITTATLNSATLTAPTISSFFNANHTHQNTTQGGKLTSAGITSLDKSLTTFSNPYKFSVYRSAALNTSASGFVTLTFDTEKFDTNNNHSGGTYTAPVNGFYQFSWGAQATLASSGQVLIASLFLNGTEEARGSRPVATGALILGSTGSALVQLVAGDTITIGVYSDNTGAFDVGLSAYNYFSGFLQSHT